MRRCLIAGVASLAIAAATPAQAIFGVGDITFDPTSYAELLNQAKQLGQQISLLQQEVQQVMSVYQAISGVRDLGSALSAASMLGLTSDLPVNPFAVQSLLHGSGGISGMAGSVGALFNSNFSQNHVYDCTGGNFNCETLKRRATSIAGIQGLSGELYQEIATKLPLLRDLKTRLDAATDLQDVAFINGQINAQQTQIAALQAQAQTLSVMQVAAYQSTQQQREERRQQEIDEARAANPDRIQ